MSVTPIRRVSGLKFEGTPITDQYMVGITTLNELEQYGFKRPSIVEKATARALTRDRSLQMVHALREEVQRKFDAPRIKRAVDYSHYIEGIVVGNLLGGTPPVTLYCPIHGEVYADGLTVPWGTPIVAVDGETQLEARFILQGRRPESGEWPFSFILYHGIPGIQAGNIMHDLNANAHPVKEKVTASLNHNGSVTRAIAAAIEATGHDPGSFNRHGAGVKKRHVTSWIHLLNGAIGYSCGESALVRNAAPRLISFYNRGANSIDEERASAFLQDMIRMAVNNPDVGKASEQVWTLSGAYSAQKGHTLTLAEFMRASTAYATTRGRGKLDEAVKAIGYVVS